MIEMVEILKLVHYTWTAADGKAGPQTQVTWRDDKGAIRVTVLEGTLRDRKRVEREVRRKRPPRR